LVVLVIVLVLAGAAFIATAFAGVNPFVTIPSPTATATPTTPPTFTPTPTSTDTPVPTPTPQPPVDYAIQSGDTCIKIAFDHQVSVASIEASNPGMSCNFLTVGTVIKVPQPTYTPTALPSATLPPEVVVPTPIRTTYTVRAGETCSLIASVYQIPIEALMQANGITDCNVIQAGQVLIIPLEAAVTPGPTPTPTLPPPYPPPVQLLPNNGDTFTAADATITLQWTSVGELRPGEFYFVRIEDITCRCARILEQPASETKFIVPTTFQPTDNRVHIYTWHITTVRQRNFGENSPAIYDSAGATSPDWSFAWVGGVATPAP
jgi:LysM repeat protein